MTRLLLPLLAGCANISTPKTGADPDDSGGVGHDSQTDSAVDSDGQDSHADSAVDSGGTDSAADSAPDSGGADSGGDSGDSASETGDTATTPPTFADCFGAYAPTAGEPYPDYDALGAVLGSHCYGTNFQDITGIQRVVFVGDSITVGSPPTDPSDFYRVQLANSLATRFGLTAPSWDWEWYNAVDGTVITAHSGDFWSCAKWGARTDDLIRDNDQILDCFPDDERDLTTLVIMTMGGNDVFSLTEDYAAGASSEELWASTEGYVELMRDAIAELKDPTFWDAPVYVLFGDVYGYSDGTGDMGSCDNAALAGFDGVVYDEDMLERLVWANEQYMSMAVDYGADMLLLDETFCGHGWNYDDPSNRCYRGAGSELWFDLTCIHPSPEGHTAIYEMFDAMVAE